jgi:glycosyltransferase involved in cell wall biosynthesis
VFVSEQNLEVTRRQFAVEPANPHVILNCSRAALLDPLPWPELNGGLQMACVARHEILWKGQDLLMDVLAREMWRQREWHLNFYGNGPDSEHLKNLAILFGLKAKVSFKGHVSDLDTIWGRNHLLVLPSRGEGAPLAILEAMTYGRPVVCTDVGGNRELIEDGSTGFIAEAPNVRCLNMALERMWNAYPALKQMGIHAHRQAETFNHVEPAKRLADLLSHCATEPISNHCERSNAQNFRCHPSV